MADPRTATAEAHAGSDDPEEQQRWLAVQSRWVEDMTSMANLGDMAPVELFLDDPAWDALRRLRGTLDRLYAEAAKHRPVIYPAPQRPRYPGDSSD